MNLKKKLKKFFTLKRRANDGFTLVELIVVIAILAILAGVGSAGYAGYIKAANKKADMTLVGNVMRAIETGTYSYAIELNEIVQVSESAKLPVGFIVLTQDGGTTMQSASIQSEINYKTPCSIQEVKFHTATKVGQDKYKSGWSNKTVDVYALTAESETVANVCVTHSTIAKETVRVWNDGVSANNDDKNLESHEVTIYKQSGSNIYVYADADHVDGQKLPMGTKYEANKVNGQYESANNQGAVYDAIVLAFGENPNLALRYDGWNVSSIPSFWSNATETWANVQELAGMMSDLVNMKILGADVGGAIASAMDINRYDNEADIVYAVTNAVKGSFDDKQAFIDQWATYGQAAEDSNLYGGDNFGMSTEYKGREFYSAMRGSYNNCVASYVKLHHSEANRDAHVAALANYGESAGDLVKDRVDIWGVDTVVNMLANENFPRQLCKASFTSESEDAKKYLGDAYGCEECKKLYDEYIKSGADLADAAAVYDTFLTAADTDPEILAGNVVDAQGNAVDFFSYYKSQLEEYEGMYGAATALANGKSAIVIQVFYEGGKLVCDVAPYDANPRND